MCLLVVSLVGLLLCSATCADDAGLTMRYVHAMTPCDETYDGDRVRVFRCLGGQNEKNSGEKRMTLDPFLIFDAYRNHQTSQFEKGFPAHPHRGFLELRYIVEGALSHNDSCGNRGVTTSGGIQALFTGRGIVHEELPIVLPGTKGIDEVCGVVGSDRTGDCGSSVFRGFQIWVNVPNSVRGNAPAYRTFRRELFPQYPLAHEAGSATLFAGRWPGSPKAVSNGPIDELLPWSTGLLFVEIELKWRDNQWVVIDTPKPQHVLLYVLEGSIVVGDSDEEPVVADVFAFLGPGDVLRVSCGDKSTASCKFILLTAPRVKEPVIISGGFVAGNEDEIKQAIKGLQDGTNTHC
jgi:quercetin 2,3-dioxygenase